MKRTNLMSEQASDAKKYPDGIGGWLAAQRWNQTCSHHVRKTFMGRLTNTLKTGLLMFLMMGLFVLVGSFMGSKFGMLIAIAMGGVTNIVMWFFSDKIALSSMRAVEVFEETQGVGGKLWHIVDELRQNADLPMPRVYICPGQSPNAFATGRSPSKAAVAITEGAMRLLSEQEVRGVMAHELAHVRNRDTLTSCIAATMAGVLAFLAQWGWHLGGGGGGDRGREGNPLIAIVVFIAAAVGASLLKAAISRSREFVADHDGAMIAGSPQGLMSALQKLELASARVPMETTNPAFNNMFIVEPLVTTRGLMNLFATHPPVESRLAALRSLLTK
jgi:heat shock protein HtpX